MTAAHQAHDAQRWLSWLCRGAVIAIVVAGIVDPACEWRTPARPLVAVLDADGTGHSQALAAARAALGRDFTVHDGPIAGADATIAAGGAPPADAPFVSGALIGVTPGAATPRCDIDAVTTPREAAAGSTVPFAVGVHAVGLTGKHVTTTLTSGGLALDEQVHQPASDDDHTSVAMALPPSAPGLDVVDVHVQSADAGAVCDARISAGVIVRDVRWRVLVADGHPSWASTFVRRALEADRRFDVVSRVGMSKAGLDAASGDAPAWSDAAALAGFDAIVVGAPDALTAADVTALERYARARGGSIVLLMDDVLRGPFAALTGVDGWRDDHSEARVVMKTPAGAMVGTAFAVPTRLAPGTMPLVTAPGASPRVVIWQTPIGAGRAVISGALDAWRYRAREGGGFVSFWVETIARAAAAAPAPLSVDVERTVAPAAATVRVRAVARDVQLSDADRPAPPVTIAGGLGDVPFRLWPTGERGVFSADVRLPDTPGAYAVHVESGGMRAEAPLSVLAKNSPTNPSADRAFVAWIAARGGRVVALDGRGEAPTLTTDVRAAIAAARAGEVPPYAGHPMRAWWWMPLLVACAGAEWWIRRRRGER